MAKIKGTQSAEEAFATAQEQGAGAAEDMAEGMVEGMVNRTGGRNAPGESKPQGAPQSAPQSAPMSWKQLAREFRYTLFATATKPLPDEFVRHMLAARKESMLAARSLIDAGIARLERDEERTKRREAHKIEVL